jgi:hypothetical protein
MRGQIITLFMLLLSLTSAPAQSPTDSTSQFNPQTAYEQATHPFDIVRRSPQNWSEIELSALKAMTDQAKEDCALHSAAEFSGKVLLDYARLCTLGRDWKPVQDAATVFITTAKAFGQTAKDTPSRDLATAYDYKVQASIRLDDAEQAFRTAASMLQTAPYDDLAAEATTSVVRYTQMLHTDWALTILSQRQATLLALIRAHPMEAPTSPNFRPNISIQNLYEQAIALPTMQQFNNQSREAATSYAELEASLPKMLSADERSSIATVRRQYLLIGSHLPHIDTFSWLPDPQAIGIPPAINEDKGSAMVLLLVPSWCNQCVALHTDFAAASQRLRANGVRFFALLAQSEPPPKEFPKDVTKTKGNHAPVNTMDHARLNPNIPLTELQLQVKPTAAALMVGTPTFVVPTHTLDDFAATDFPLVVVADHDGIIRSIQFAADNPLAPGGFVDQVVDRVIALWPSTQP